MQPAQGQRDQAVQETRNIKLFLESLDRQLQSMQSSDLSSGEEAMEIHAKKSILAVMQADQEIKLVNSKQDAEKKTQVLHRLEGSIILKQRQLAAYNRELAKLQSGS